MPAATALDSAPPADGALSLSFSDGLGLSDHSGLVAVPRGRSLPVPEAPAWLLLMGALPIVLQRRRAS